MAETKEKLIEKLENLATFFALAKESALTQTITAKKKGNIAHASFNQGREMAYDTAFTKLDVIIEEAKK